MSKKLSNNQRIVLSIFGMLIGFLFEELSFVLAIIYWLIISSFFIKFALDYKKGIRSSEIRIPTRQDEYVKMTYVSIGFMILLGLLIAYVFIEKLSLVLLSGSVLGVLLMVYGFIKLPQGIMNINNGQLSYLTNQGTIEIKDINEIVINNNNIHFFGVNGDLLYRVNQLELDEKSKTELMYFFVKQLPITNNQITVRDKIWQTILNDANEP